MPSVLTTSYYRDLQEIPNIGESKKPAKSNFDPYLIFCLESRIKPFLSSTERTIIKGIPSKERIDYVMEIYNGSEIVILDTSRYFQLNTAIKYIVSNDPHHCIAYIPSYIKCIPTTYQHKLETMVSLNGKLDHYIQDHMHFVDFSNLYDNTTEYSNDFTANFDTFKEKYKNIHDSIREQLSEFYRKGYIFCHKDFADEWQLVKVDSEIKTNTSLHSSENDIDHTPDNLYYANWTLPILEDLYPFLTSRIFRLPFKYSFRHHRNEETIEFFIKNFEANFPDGTVDGKTVSVVLKDFDEASLFSSLASHFLRVLH